MNAQHDHYWIVYWMDTMRRCLRMALQVVERRILLGGKVIRDHCNVELTLTL